METLVCGDCGAEGCQWASVNRGVYLCDQCVTVHRQLGRHYSQVKHLTQSQWEPHQLEMLASLVKNGANKIWEHNLVDPAFRLNKKYIPKPTSHDSLERKKSYIKAKYEQAMYMCKDEDAASDDLNELNAQLFAAARTNELLTSLRLLAHGARPDWQNPERGFNCSLHVAAASNQPLQIELLAVYGANPSVMNEDRKSAEEVALDKGHYALANRITEIRFEVLDRLSFYRYQKKPSHAKGQHYVRLSDCDEEQTTNSGNMSKLPETTFQELCADVFDEVDRRELETIWVASVSGRTLPIELRESHAPHLSIHPGFSMFRNQGRQKMATFSQTEFFHLLNDIVQEIIKRAGFLDESDLSVSGGNDDSDFDERIYDDVASLSTADNITKESDAEVAEITATHNEDKIRIKELQQEVETHLKTIAQLQEENRQFKTKITRQAQELESYRNPNHRRSVIAPLVTEMPSQSYDHICKGVIRSLRQWVEALQSKDLEKLENHTAEMTRCLSDLIVLFEGNTEMIKKLEESREKLRESCSNLSANPSTDDLQPLYTNAYETAALIRRLIEPS